MNDLLIAALIMVSIISICVIMYYVEVIVPVRREQKQYWNPFTQSFDTKPSKGNYLPKEQYRNFKN